MQQIKVLSEDIINKIAAGEVVQRPASVVKELIENALDAKATQIKVEIEDSGKKLIRISDNGHGMSEKDARLSIIRHATSKIQDIDDLFAIQTLGFRGEALASIAAVSQLSLITKKEEALEGFNLVIEGGVIISEGAIGAQRGSVIEVANLFFNTPARKKFLKTDAVELRHIIDVVTNYALCNKDVSFILQHEKHTLLNSAKTNSQRDNIASIYGVKVATRLLEVETTNELIGIKGFIDNPYHAANNTNSQVLFVNGRWIKNQDITKAIYEAYSSLLFTHKHPVFVLEFNINEEQVDVNVHPQKSEVKFEKKEQIVDFITSSLRDVLKSHQLVPIVDVEFADDVSEVPSNSKYSFEPSTQTILAVNDTSYIGDEELSTPDSGVVLEDELPLEEDEFIGEEELSEEKKTSKVVSTLPPMRFLGQIHKTFFVAETEGGMLLIDQHAAHERVMFEKFLAQFKEKKVVKQNLLQGGMLEVNLAQVAIIKDNLELLSIYGFELEYFGGNTFILKTIPQIFYRLQHQEAILDLIESLDDTKNSVEKVHHEIVSRMACRAAVMAGDELTASQMQNILHELGRCDHPFSCAHGRPTMIKTSSHELEKKFKRC